MVLENRSYTPRWLTQKTVLLVHSCRVAADAIALLSCSSFTPLQGLRGVDAAGLVGMLLSQVLQHLLGIRKAYCTEDSLLLKMSVCMGDHKPSFPGCTLIPCIVMLLAGSEQHCAVNNSCAVFMKPSLIRQTCVTGHRCSCCLK